MSSVFRRPYSVKHITNDERRTTNDRIRNAVVIKSYAKLNLYLAVLNKRKDNYHNIETLFERIDLHDTIALKKLPGKAIKIVCDHPAVPADTSNLCYKSAKLLQKSLGVNYGVEIKITKRIPVAAGLGGGSSNAAYTLIGLNKLWRLGLSKDKLARLGRLIGADVPFFIMNTPFAIATGRGDKIKPLARINK
ncbi:MAG: 4-(cytidine 5'-diphospho)-2-C-methyl-D-erythritol kinase, partial [Candidatus Omnitrophota bacterium]|nr:4-(cytidine 5'-diphospho)-2-C-methyl-D-erythritol kinase [Candidatus Omnitrophota bacterium]